MTTYLIAIATQLGIYGLLALSLNLQWGFAGLLNFGIAGFFAAGAYAYAIAVTTFGWPVPIALAFAMLVGAIVAYPLGLASIRLRIGFYLAIATLGFAEVMRAVIVNEDWLTEGTRGLAVPMLFPGLSTGDNRIAMLVVVIVALGLVYLLLQRIGLSPFGRTLEAIRDNEDAARSLGKPVAGYKIKVFMLGAAIAGGAGALNASYVSFLVPDQFLPIITFNIWMAMIIGGSGSNRGVLLGVLILVTFLEGSRFLKDLVPPDIGLTDARIASLRLMVIGIALTVIPMNWPRGIWGRKEL